MVTCPNCNTQNPDDARSCSNCGAPLSEALYHAQSPPPEGVPPEFVEIPEPSPQYPAQEHPQEPEAPLAPEPPAPPETPAPTPAPIQPAPTPAGSIKKDRSLAYLLEILPGIFGLLGLGWIYSGNLGVGLIVLVGYLIWDVIALVAAAVTGFLACFCIIPINIVPVIISVLLLNNFIQAHSELFKE